MKDEIRTAVELGDLIQAEAQHGSAGGFASGHPGYFRRCRHVRETLACACEQYIVTANGDAREEVVHAESGGIGHSATETTGAESTPFTREGDDAAMAAVSAAHAQESVRQDATAKAGGEFVAHEGGQLTAAGPAAMTGRTDRDPGGAAQGWTLPRGRDTAARTSQRSLAMRNAPRKAGPASAEP